MTKPVAIDPIVSADWLQANQADVVICDVRYYLDGRDGHAAYLAGHLPDARYIDMDTVLAVPAGPIIGRHPLPTPDAFASGLAAAGIANDAVVVAYDDLGGTTSGRLVWMLRRTGHEAAMLNGGLHAWDGTIDTGPVDVAPAGRTPVAWPDDMLITADDVVNHIENGGVVVDSRSTQRYAGEVEPVDPKAGHVPGAINLPFTDNMVDGRFRTAAELAARFTAVGVDADAIIYCGSGVSACHNLLAAEHAGVGISRLYVGSWSGWSTDTRPVATGETPSGNS